MKDSQGDRTKILVVDDDESLRRLLAARKDLSEAMQVAAGRDATRVGFCVILAVAEEQRGNPRGAVDALDQRALAVAIQGLQRKAAGVDLAAFSDELLDLLVEVLVAREGLVAQQIGRAHV